MSVFLFPFLSSVYFSCSYYVIITTCKTNEMMNGNVSEFSRHVKD